VRPALSLGGVVLAAVLTACIDSGEAPGDADSGAGQAEPAAAQAPAAPVAATAMPPVGPLPDGIVPTRYALDLNIDPNEARFSGTVAIDVELAAPHERIWLHGLGLDVTETYAVDTDGARVAATYAQALESGVASLSFERALPEGSATLNLAYSAAFNMSVNALFRAERGGAAYVASQLEPIAGRQIFPGFDDPRFKTPWDVSITTRADDVAVTNAPEVRATPAEDGRIRHEFATTERLPTYLLAFAVGPYDVVEAEPIPPTSVRDRPVPLRGIAAQGAGARFGISLTDTPALLSWLEQYFGTPYPYQKLDLIAMPASFGGAMENAGAVTYDDFLILVGENPPLQQRRAYMNVHAHELAHMWFGDLVTPTWWTDIWLNEAFATWMANKAAEAVWPEGEFGRATLAGALGAMAADSLASARQIREPVLRNEEIEDAFDGITYEKGGGVLAMFESFLGEEAFRDGVRLHMERFAHDVATAGDFIASMAEGSGQPGIEASFRSFIEQPGVPVVAASLECAEDAAPQIELRQRRYAPLGSRIAADTQQWQIPVCIAYETVDAPGRVCEMLDAQAATIDLDLDECPSAIHPNAGGAGYYRFSLDEQGWTALIESAPALDAAEALTLVDSLDAAFRAGTVSAEGLVGGLIALADHEAWDVVSATIARFAGLLDVLAPADRERAEAVLRDTYAPKYAALADGADESSQLLRRDLLAFLALEVDDAEIRAELAALAARYVGMDGEPETDAVPGEVLGTVLGAGVQELDAEFFAELTETAVTTEDPYVRDMAFAALGRVENPALAAELRAAILDERFPLTRAVRMIMAQLGNDATRDVTWDWVRQNADAVIAIVPEFFRTQVVPRFGASFCSEERSAEVEQFVVSHADALPGYQRSLDQVQEQIALCGTLREAKAAELARAFTTATVP
jgi:alanyl aminopeptidase